MRLLLDSHTLLWWVSDDARLAPTAGDAIADPRNQVFVSAVTFWELAIKRSLGRLGHDLVQLHQDLAKLDIAELPVTAEHALSIETLPPVHRDPFDRMLVAQARHESLTLVTADRFLRDYGIAILPAA